MAKVLQMKKYSARPGSPISDEEANLVGRETEEMSKEGIALTARSLLDRARDRRSPIHSLFDWNDSTAAEKYRRDWAGKLLGSVQVIEVSLKRKAKAFYSIKIDQQEIGKSLPSDHPHRIYESRRNILINDDARSQLSRDQYIRIVGICNDIEGLGLDKDIPEWRSIIAVVRTNPIGMPEPEVQINKA